jgi:hypothetical protein
MKQLMSNAYGPRYRTTCRAGARLVLSASIAIALAGCDSEPEPLEWYEAPADPQVTHFVFQQCLKASTGPRTTKYNDQDEAIEECRRAAGQMDYYCPEGAVCLPNIPTRADVRSILPSDTDGHPQGGNAKQVPSDSLTAGPEGNRP